MKDVQRPRAPEATALPRKLGLFDSTMINVGCMIGSGIFIVPALVALTLHSSFLMTAVWIIGGVVSLFGALSVAELGGMFPRAGGQYVYLSEAFSPLFGFLYGWTGFLVVNTASIAAVAVTGAAYTGYFLELSPGGVKLVALAGIWILTIINCFGVRVGAGVQNALTSVKILALVSIPVAALLLPGGNVENFNPILPADWGTGLAGPLGLAMVAILWSYEGWIEITFVAGEVRHPERNLHRSLIASTIIVTLLYTAVTAAFIYLLSPEGMAGSPLVASDAVSVMLGPAGASLVAATVIVSTFGANNGFIFTCPRIYYEMAREGLFFRWLAYVHPRFLTPIPSLMAQGILSSILVLTGTFEELTTYVIFASFLFYGLSATGVILLRRNSPEKHRPYRTWGYPWTPIVFIGFSSWLVINAVVENPVDSLIGLGIIATGIPAYFFYRRR